MQSKSDRAGRVSSGRKPASVVQRVGEWLRSQWQGLRDAGAPAPQLQPVPVRRRDYSKNASNRGVSEMRNWS